MYAILCDSIDDLKQNVSTGEVPNKSEQEVKYYLLICTN